MASSDSQRAELPDVNINTGVQSINIQSLFKLFIAAKMEEENCKV